MVLDELLFRLRVSHPDVDVRTRLVRSDFPAEGLIAPRARGAPARRGVHEPRGHGEDVSTAVGRELLDRAATPVAIVPAGARRGTAPAHRELFSRVSQPTFRTGADSPLERRSRLLSDSHIVAESACRGKVAAIPRIH